MFRYMVFSKTTACSSYVQPWLVAIGGWRLVEIAGWRLAVGGWRRLAAVGGSWQLVMGGWWRLAAVDSWQLVAVGGWRRLVAVGGWRLAAVGGSWRLAVGGPLRRSLTKQKKSGPLRTALSVCLCARVHVCVCVCVCVCVRVRVWPYHISVWFLCVLFVMQSHGGTEGHGRCLQTAPHSQQQRSGMSPIPQCLLCREGTALQAGQSTTIKRCQMSATIVTHQAKKPAMYSVAFTTISLVRTIVSSKEKRGGRVTANGQQL